MLLIQGYMYIFPLSNLLCIGQKRKKFLNCQRSIQYCFVTTFLFKCQQLWVVGSPILQHPGPLPPIPKPRPTIFPPPSRPLLCVVCMCTNVRCCAVTIGFYWILLHCSIARTTSTVHYTISNLCCFLNYCAENCAEKSTNSAYLDLNAREAALQSGL